MTSSRKPNDWPFAVRWPGGPKWVQSHISDLSVLPDGRILTASPWDEAHREQSLYSADGELLGGYNTTQCRVVGGDARYVYAIEARAQPAAERPERDGAHAAGHNSQNGIHAVSRGANGMNSA
jgi:hypothetical protein